MIEPLTLAARVFPTPSGTALNAIEGSRGHKAQVEAHFQQHGIVAGGLAGGEQGANKNTLVV